MSNVSFCLLSLTCNTAAYDRPLFPSPATKKAYPQARLARRTAEGGLLDPGTFRKRRQVCCQRRHVLSVRSLATGEQTGLAGRTGIQAGNATMGELELSSAGDCERPSVEDCDVPDPRVVDAVIVHAEGGERRACAPTHESEIVVSRQCGDRYPIECIDVAAMPLVEQTCGGASWEESEDSAIVHKGSHVAKDQIRKGASESGHHDHDVSSHPPYSQHSRRNSQQPQQQQQLQHADSRHNHTSFGHQHRRGNAIVGASNSSSSNSQVSTACSKRSNGDSSASTSRDSTSGHHGSSRSSSSRSEKEGQQHHLLVSGSHLSQAASGRQRHSGAGHHDHHPTEKQRQHDRHTRTNGSAAVQVSETSRVRMHACKGTNPGARGPLISVCPLRGLLCKRDSSAKAHTELSSRSPWQGSHASVWVHCHHGEAHSLLSHIASTLTHPSHPPPFHSISASLSAHTLPSS